MVLAVVLAGCAAARGEAPGGSSPPLVLTGQRVLVLPVRSDSGVTASVTESLGAELRFALGERDGDVVWISPDQLRATLRRSPGLAPDPGLLPADRLVHGGEARVGGMLAGVLRRYAALANARLVLLPGVDRTISADSVPRLRLGAALIDVRTDGVVWRGSVQGAAPAPGDATGARALAAALAERLLVGGS